MSDENIIIGASWKVACDYCAHIYEGDRFGPYQVLNVQDRKICLDCIVLALDKILGPPILKNE